VVSSFRFPHQNSVCISLLPQARQWGKRWRSWLRDCATRRNVAGVIGIFHWHNLSSRTMAIGLTHPLIEMSTSNISCGVKVDGAYGWQTYHLIVPTVMKSGSLNLLESSGPVQACNATKRSAKPVWPIPLVGVHWKTPDDGQRNCPKHVEFYCKNKFEKLVHLVGFIIQDECHLYTFRHVIAIFRESKKHFGLKLMMNCVLWFLFCCILLSIFVGKYIRHRLCVRMNTMPR